MLYLRSSILVVLSTESSAIIIETMLDGSIDIVMRKTKQGNERKVENGNVVLLTQKSLPINLSPT